MAEATATQGVSKGIAASLDEVGVGIDFNTIIQLIQDLLKMFGVCGKQATDAYRMTKVILFGGWYLGVNVHRARLDQMLNSQCGEDSQVVKAAFKDALLKMTTVTFGAVYSEAQQAA